MSLARSGMEVNPTVPVPYQRSEKRATCSATVAGDEETLLNTPQHPNLGTQSSWLRHQLSGTDTPWTGPVVRFASRFSMAIAEGIHPSSPRNMKMHANKEPSMLHMLKIMPRRPNSPLFRSVPSRPRSTAVLHPFVNGPRRAHGKREGTQGSDLSRSPGGGLWRWTAQVGLTVDTRPQVDCASVRAAQLRLLRPSFSHQIRPMAHA